MATRKNFYFVITTCEEGKYSSCAEKLSTSENLASVLSGPNIHTANICASKKEAEETAAFWNECHKKNGNYRCSVAYAPTEEEKAGQHLRAIAVGLDRHIREWYESAYIDYGVKGSFLNVEAFGDQSQHLHILWEEDGKRYIQD